MPIIEMLEKLDYKKLLSEYELANGKPLKPVQRRKYSVVNVPEKMTCARCFVRSAYLYANNGNKGQYRCKVCTCCFSQKNRFLKEAIIKCPHCLKTLDRIKEVRSFMFISVKTISVPTIQIN